MGFSKRAFITILTIAYLASIKTAAQESNCSPAPSQLISWPLLWACLLILFANTDPDINADIDSEQQILSQNLFSYDELVLLERLDDIGPLSLSDLQQIESMENGTDLAHGEDQRVVEEADEVDKHVIITDLTTLSSHDSDIIITDHHLIALSSSDSGVIEHVYAEQNLDSANIVGTAEQMYSVHKVNENSVLDKNCSEGGTKKIEKDFCGITLSDLQQQFGKKLDIAAKCLGVSRSTFKRCCRANGIAKWSRNLEVLSQTGYSILGLDAMSDTLTQRVENMATFQSDDTMISVKVSYRGVIVRFPFALTSGKNELEEEVKMRFGIQIGSFSIKYEDEEKDWILITCDVDLHHGMHIYKTKGITPLKMKVELTLVC